MYTAVGWYSLSNVGTTPLQPDIIRWPHHRTEQLLEYFLSLIVSKKVKIKLNNESADWLCETFTKPRKCSSISKSFEHLI